MFSNFFRVEGDFFKVFQLKFSAGDCKTSFYLFWVKRGKPNYSLFVVAQTSVTHLSLSFSSALVIFYSIPPAYRTWRQIRLLMRIMRLVQFRQCGKVP